MGLTTSHDCWHGGYISFMHFRRALARAAGLPPLLLMEGFYEEPLLFKYPLADETATSEIARLLDGCPIKWDSLRDDPLIVLLNHSDSSGEIAVEHLLPLATRLEEVAPLMAAVGDSGPRWAQAARDFAAGCRFAAEAGEPVEFR